MANPAASRRKKLKNRSWFDPLLKTVAKRQAVGVRHEGGPKQLQNQKRKCRWFAGRLRFANRTGNHGVANRAKNSSNREAQALSMDLPDSFPAGLELKKLGPQLRKP
jgi:hypothetical protein